MRNEYIDFMKGKLIFLVVLGHSIQYSIYSNEFVLFSDPLFIFIYSFHMPMFILISGYLYFFSQVEEWWKLFGKIRTLFIPIFSVISIYFLFKSLLSGVNYSFYDFLFTLTHSLWFLWVLMGILIARYLFSLTSSLFLRFLSPRVSLLINSAFYGSSIYIITNFWGWWFVSEFIYLLPFFIIGELIAIYMQKRKFNKKILMLMLTAGGIGVLMLMFWKTEYYIYQDKLGSFDLSIYLYRMLAGVGLCSLFFVFSHYCFILLKKEITRFIALLGTSSLFIYILSSFIQPKFIGLYNSNFNILFSLAISLLFVVVFLLSSILVQRNKVTHYMFFGR